MPPEGATWLMCEKPTIELPFAGAAAPLPPVGGNGVKGFRLLAVGAAGTAAPWPCVVRPSPALCWGRAGGAGAGVCRGSCRAVGRREPLPCPPAKAQVKQGRTEGATRLERLLGPVP